MKALYILPPESKINLETEAPTKGWWMPMGALAIGSYVKKELPDVDYQIIDGEVENYNDIVTKINEGSDLALFSPNIVNYDLTLELAQIAKNAGAKVVFGGHHATSFGEIMLKKQKDLIDCIVMYDGEVATADLLKGKPFSEISGLLYYNQENQLIKNNPQELSLDEYPNTNWDLIDPEPYFEKHEKNYRSQFPDCTSKRPATIVSQRGCRWRENQSCNEDENWRGCIYCSRIETKWRGRDVQRVWDEIREVKEKFQADSVIDVGDDFLSSPEWFDDFYAARPEDLKDISLRFLFTRPDPRILTPERIEKIKDLGCQTVFFGIESGNQEILNIAMRGLTTEDNLQAAKNIADKGMKFSVGFVLGITGENENSLKETRRHATKLVEIGAELLSVSILDPHPGSYAWKQLQRTYPEKYGNDVVSDKLNFEEMQRDYVQAFCPDIKYEDLLEFQHEIIELKPEGSIREYGVDQMSESNQHLKLS